MGDSTRDLPALQAAVAAGGRVKLRGTFDLGPAGMVLIGPDVEISGEDGATVKGGRWSFHSPLPKDLPPVQPGPAVSIRDLTFDGALHAPIHIAHARSVHVTHNQIRNVRPWVVTPANPAIPIQGFAMQTGVLLGTQTVAGKLGTIPGAFTGRVEVTGNRIELASDIPTQTLGIGIWMTRGWGVEARIAGNDVANASRNAIEALDSVLDADGRGSVEISHNRVRSGVHGVPYPTPSVPNGIVAGWFFDPAGAIDPERNVRHRIADNEVECHGASSVGIFLNAAGGEVEGNRVSVDGASSLGVVVNSPGAKLSRNVVSGRATAAFWFGTVVPPARPDGVISSCDRVRGFAAGLADMCLEGKGGRVRGFNGTVLDRGGGSAILPRDGCDGDHHREPGQGRHRD